MTKFDGLCFFVSILEAKAEEEDMEQRTGKPACHQYINVCQLQDSLYINKPLLIIFETILIYIFNDLLLNFVCGCHLYCEY